MLNSKHAIKNQSLQEQKSKRILSMAEALQMQSHAGYTQLDRIPLEGKRFVLAKEEEHYPSCLLDLEDPPELLYGIGNPRVLEGGLAIIGARRATPYGRSCAETFSKIAAKRGVVIISGGARGCDSWALESALDAGGFCVAVLGGGLHQLYPQENRRLFERIIAQGGAVISEHQWDYPPLRHTFRARNRIIAALSKAVLIVEASLPSGTFSTADEALKIDREVFAVPGAISSSHSAGSNQLIYQGASPIISKQVFCELIDEMFGTFGLIEHDEKENLTQPARKLLEVLAAMPMSMEEMLAESCESRIPRDIAGLSMVLAELQKKHLVCLYPDGRYGMATARSW